MTYRVPAHLPEKGKQPAGGCARFGRHTCWCMADAQAAATRERERRLVVRIVHMAVCRLGIRQERETRGRGREPVREAIQHALSHSKEVGGGAFTGMAHYG